MVRKILKRINTRVGTKRKRIKPIMSMAYLHNFLLKLMYPLVQSLRGMPFVSPLAPSMYFAVPDPQLHAKIVTQIDYYFSNKNLVRDIYL
uniref:HTH La-type RNA-binding domain-containing protein n=1 Tax=Lactuca sativa TaxID=4236 RepID=A0A9R1XPH2_LACSA|nr:hypothetical protein LSAT_V11C300108250 [Lactuca sativa]